MTTIKSYTDLVQSKTLAEILPVESADMSFNNVCLKGLGYSGPFEASLVPYKEACEVNQKNIDFYSRGGTYNGVIAWKILPCWSLAALLDVLPKVHGLRPMVDLEEVSIQYSGSDFYTINDNLVDACYEMIIRLHEQNLL